ADSAQRRFDPHPIRAGERRDVHVLQDDAAERSQPEGRALARRPAGQEIASRAVMEPDREQRLLRNGGNDVDAPPLCPGAAARLRERISVAKEATTNIDSGQESRVNLCIPVDRPTLAA